MSVSFLSFVKRNPKKFQPHTFQNFIHKTANNPILTNTNLTGELPKEVLKIAQHNRKVGVWLMTCSGLVFGIVIIGGLTRLTRSGLSMTDWKFHGGLPPLNDEQWSQEFTKYKQFPEFQLVNESMTVDEFKQIYKWEYIHRMYGRSIGLVFTLPLVYFIARGYLHRPLMAKLGGLLMLGTGQGFIGWWMVKSGLESEGNQTYNNLVKVSPYRLATHLGLAFTLYCGLLYTSLYALSQSPKQLQVISKFVTGKSGHAVPTVMRRSAATVSLITFMTAIMGAFVAGNDAGMVYDTWPKMGNHYIPSDLVNPHIKPLYRNLFENSTMVQFVHRELAYLTVFASTVLFIYSGRLHANKLIARNVLWLSGGLCTLSYLQASVGVLTLLNHVPISLASLHQGGSMLVLTAAIWLLFLCRRGGFSGNQKLMQQLLQKGKPSFLVV